MQRTVVVSERTDADEAQRDLVEQIIAAAAHTGHEVVVTPDLYHLSEDSPVWDELRALPRRVTLWAWQHPRPLRWLLTRHHVDADEWQLFDLRTMRTADDVYPPSPLSNPEGHVRRLSAAPLVRWYPVIDRELCQTCGHCQEFCLFGVYERDQAEQVRVANPDNCKAGCPACSRICPHGAIMFPLYDQDPAIAGAPGTVMSLDAAGRRLYYERTGETCPTCAQLTDAQLAHVAQDGFCPECGRKFETPSPVVAEIDDLIARLDRLSGGGKQ